MTSDEARLLVVDGQLAVYRGRGRGVPSDATQPPARANQRRGNCTLEPWKRACEHSALFRPTRLHNVENSLRERCVVFRRVGEELALLQV